MNPVENLRFFARLYGVQKADERIEALLDRATYELPMEFPTGIEWVLVNGVVTVEHGRHTGAKAGKVLRGPGWRTDDR